MKILVYGAGVIGSIFAYKLKVGGNDVTLLARGNRLEQLQKNGLVLRDDIIHKEFKEDINVIDKLNPDDEYDVALVIMQRQQVGEILPILKNIKKISTIIFMGNNVSGANEYLQTIDKERIMLGFGGPGGYKENHLMVVAYLDKTFLYAGELDGRISKRALNIEKVFTNSGIKVEISENIDAWLKTHVAFIIPLAMATYAARKNNKKLFEDDGLLDLSIIALRENLKAIKELGIPILPKKFKMLKYFPKSLFKRKLQKLFNSEFGRIAFSGHADAAQAEMMRLTTDFMELVKNVKTNLSTTKKLYELSFT